MMVNSTEPSSIPTREWGSLPRRKSQWPAFRSWVLPPAVKAIRPSSQ